MNRPARFTVQEIRAATQAAKAEGARITLKAGEWELIIDPPNMTADNHTAEFAEAWINDQIAKKASRRAAP